MIKQAIKIALPSGLEARPVALLVQVASQYESSIYVESNDRTVNAKSIMGMMSLAPDTGDKLTIACDGSDEDEALAGIKMFLTGNDK